MRRRQIRSRVGSTRLELARRNDEKDCQSSRVCGTELLIHGADLPPMILGNVGYAHCTRYLPHGSIDRPESAEWLQGPAVRSPGVSFFCTWDPLSRSRAQMT